VNVLFIAVCLGKSLERECSPKVSVAGVLQRMKMYLLYYLSVSRVAWKMRVYSVNKMWKGSWEFENVHYKPV
jgi:hypothetical protein